MLALFEIVHSEEKPNIYRNGRTVIFENRQICPLYCIVVVFNCPGITINYDDRTTCFTAYLNTHYQIIKLCKFFRTK